MARITVEDCLEAEPNRFLLVLLAAKRTKEILKGKKVKVTSVKNKPVVTSLREIAAREVRFMTAEETAERDARAAELEAENGQSDLLASGVSGSEMQTREITLGSSNGKNGSSHAPEREPDA